MTWRASVITLFPELFPGPLGASVIGRGLEEGRWSLETTNLRDFGVGKHRNVDDTPSGGGPGMVLRADVIANALAAVQGEDDERRALLMSPRGTPFDQERAHDLAAGGGAIILCGRFEGVDQRAIDHCDLEEVSMGDYVLAGGEVAAMALIEACVRLVPGVLGAENSQDEESFETGLLEYPHYTRPAQFEGLGIPEILVSGDHKKVAAWRREKAEKLTRERRVDLWQKFERESRKNSQSAVDK